MMTPVFASLFQPYLLPGERILWTGRPKRGLVLRPADALLIPFSLLWAGFAVFWNISVWTMSTGDEGPGLDFKLFGIPFLVAGFYFVIGRFFHDAAIRKKLVYAVTDQRVLVVKDGRFGKLKSLDLNYLPQLGLNEHRDGTGTITFQDDDGYLSKPWRTAGIDPWAPSLTSSSQFSMIDNPRKVYHLIREKSLVPNSCRQPRARAPSPASVSPPG